MLVVAAHEFMTGRDEQSHVINLGACLIESLAQILELEANEIHSRRRADANHLALLQFRRPTRVMLHVGLADGRHRVILLPLAVGKSTTLVKRIDEAAGDQLANKLRFGEPLRRDSWR